MMSTPVSSILTKAQTFAAALDREDFGAASALLDARCVYASPTGEMVGVTKIIDSYRANAEWASATFDRIRYESAVEARPDGTFLITFTDHTVHAGLKNTYRCQQILTFDNPGRISRIEHREIDGQRELLDAFFGKCGIARPAAE